MTLTIFTCKNQLYKSNSHSQPNRPTNSQPPQATQFIIHNKQTRQFKTNHTNKNVNRSNRCIKNTQSLLHHMHHTHNWICQYYQKNKKVINMTFTLSLHLLTIYLKLRISQVINVKQEPMPLVIPTLSLLNVLWVKFSFRTTFF